MIEWWWLSDSDGMMVIASWWLRHGDCAKRFPISRAYFPFEGIFPPFSVAYFPLFFFEGVFPPWLENVLEAEWIFSFWSCHFFSPSLDVWKEKVIFRVFKSKGSFIYFDGLHVINSRNKELPFYFIKASFLTLLLNRPRQDFEKEQLYTANKKWIPSCFSSTEYFQSNQPLMPGFFSAVFEFSPPWLLWHSLSLSALRFWAPAPF